MSIAYLLIATIVGSFAAVISLLLGHSGVQAMINYVLMGNLSAFLMISWSWGPNPDARNKP